MSPQEDLDAIVPPDDATLEPTEAQETDDGAFDALSAKTEKLIEDHAAPAAPAKPAPAAAQEPSEATPAPAPAAPAESAKPTAADEKILEVLDNGEVVLNVKGKQIPVRDLPKEELSRYVQMGVRFSQKMKEVNDREADLEKKAKAIMDGTKIVQKYLSTAQQAPAKQTLEEKPPAELAPNEYDSDEARAMKAQALEVWKENQRLKAQVNTVGTQMQATDFEAASRDFFSEIDTLKETYPAASIDEVIAVKAFYPEVPLERLMQVSNEKYANQEVLDRAFKANPALKREYDESVIKVYLAKQSSARIPASTRIGGAPPAAAPAPKKPAVMDFDTLADRTKAAIAASSQSGD